MKKHTVFAISCAFALSMTTITSCGSKDDKEKVAKDNDGEVEAEYYDVAYDIDEEDIIDPYDEDAYREYGSGYEEEETVETEEEEYDGPSDVDLLDMPVTDSSQIDLILDDFSYLNESLKRLYSEKVRNTAFIQKGLDRAVRITEKINEGSEHMTQTQLRRYEQLTNEFLDIIKK